MARRLVGEERDNARYESDLQRTSDFQHDDRTVNGLAAMSKISITSYVQFAALVAFTAILVTKVSATAAAGLNPFAFLFRKERRGVTAETAFLIVAVFLFVEIALQTFNRPIRFLPHLAYKTLEMPGHYAAGVLVVAIAFVFLVRGYLDLGRSWRIGTDPHQL